MPVVLVLCAEVHDHMVGHAIAGLPDEACGLFAGPAGADRVERFYPMTNAARSSRVYRLDPAEMLAVEREADESALVVMGVMHSHTHTANYPSPTDMADAATFDPLGSWRFVIVSLRHPDPSLRAYRMIDETITEEPVTIVDGSVPAEADRD